MYLTLELFGTLLFLIGLTAALTKQFLFRIGVGKVRKLIPLTDGSAALAGGLIILIGIAFIVWSQLPVILFLATLTPKQ
jgi:hypothetical protein